MKDVPTYDEDFYAWTQSTSQALAQGRIDGIDLCRVAEEIADLGKSERSSLTSHLRRIILHLLKIRYQPEKHTRSWDLSIVESRIRMTQRLRESPSLRASLHELSADAYESARVRAARETGLPLETFPEECPFTLDEIAG